MFGLILSTFITSYSLGPKFNSIEEASKRYGKLTEDYQWPNRNKWLKRIDLRDLDINVGYPYAYVNKDMLVPFVVVLLELKKKGLLDEIKEFQGCYSPRSVRGHDRPSIHAYGLGCDFNDGPFSKEFVRTWETFGFCWGGTFKNTDQMHFSYAWECSEHEHKRKEK